MTCSNDIQIRMEAILSEVLHGSEQGRKQAVAQRRADDERQQAALTHRAHKLAAKDQAFDSKDAEGKRALTLFMGRIGAASPKGTPRTAKAFLAKDATRTARLARRADRRAASAGTTSLAAAPAKKPGILQRFKSWISKP